MGSTCRGIPVPYALKSECIISPTANKTARSGGKIFKYAVAGSPLVNVRRNRADKNIPRVLSPRKTALRRNFLRKTRSGNIGINRLSVLACLVPVLEGSVIKRLRKLSAPVICSNIHSVLGAVFPVNVECRQPVKSHNSNAFPRKERKVRINGSGQLLSHNAAVSNSRKAFGNSD